MACKWPHTCAGCSKLDKILETGERACATCVWFGPKADMVPICHKYIMTMLPCDWCGEWERREGKWQPKNKNA